MPKYIFFLLFATILSSSFAQDGYMEEIKIWQQKHDDEFADPDESPLEKRDLKKFHGLDYFPIDRGFRVVASFTRTPNSMPFSMATSTSRLPIYTQYGIVTFSLDEQELSLAVYQSQDPFVDEEYKDHLFLPFVDLTCGKESYGGGRYVDSRYLAQTPSSLISIKPTILIVLIVDATLAPFPQGKISLILKSRQV